MLHCSAGIGRTGTLIAIFNIIESFKTLIEQVADRQSFLKGLLEATKDEHGQDNGVIAK